MRFITRKLYRSMQPGSRVSERRAERLWKKASMAQRDHFQTIESQLPESMRQFAAVSLHDGIIKKVKRTTPNEIRFKIDCRNNPWGPSGRIILTFRGVKSAEGLDKVLGRLWLYEEIDLHPEAGFQFSVLLDKHEFWIVADDVEFQLLS